MFYLESIGLYTIESVYIGSICFAISESAQRPIICVVAFLYASHWGAIVLLLFTRLYFVFLGTARAISKCMIYLFFTVCIFGLIVLILFAIAHIMEWHIWVYWTRILSALSLILISIWLIWSFVYRLFQTGRDSHHYSDNKELSRTLKYLMATMTRYTVLAVISVTSTLALFVGLFFIGDESTGIAQIVWNLLIIIDITTNVICNTLFYAFATPGYKKLCGCLNERFRDRYVALMEKQQKEQEQDENYEMEVKEQSPMAFDPTQLKLPSPTSISRQITTEDQIRDIERRATIIAE